MSDRKAGPPAASALPPIIPPTQVAKDLFNGAADVFSDLQTGLKDGPLKVMEKGSRRGAQIFGSTPDRNRRN